MVAKDVEWRRKLPPYGELKRLYLSGKSYDEIAKMYGVYPTSVGKTLRARAKRRGEYPFPKQHTDKVLSKKITKSNETRNINGIAIWEMVQEHKEELGVSWAEYSQKCGIKERTIMDYRMRYKRRSRTLPVVSMSRKNARTLLEFIGEQVPSWL